MTMAYRGEPSPSFSRSYAPASRTASRGKHECARFGRMHRQGRAGAGERVRARAPRATCSVGRASRARWKRSRTHRSITRATDEWPPDCGFDRCRLPPSPTPYSLAHARERRARTHGIWTRRRRWLDEASVRPDGRRFVASRAHRAGRHIAPALHPSHRYAALAPRAARAMRTLVKMELTIRNDARRAPTMFL